MPPSKSLLCREEIKSVPQHFLDLLSPFSGSAGTNLRHVNRGETETASGVDALTFT